MCRHVVEDERPFVVEDFLTTERFREQHLRMGSGVRFYAGTPLKTSEGHAIGSLCLVDSRPRGFDDKDSATLRAFAGAVVGRLEALGAAAHERDAGSVASESDRITRRLLSCYLGIGEAYPAWRAVTLRQKRPPSGRDGVLEADLRMRSDRSY
jgi:hypothetical protein